MSFLSLPNEMIEMIFHKLNDLNEMLKCRLVSKRCKLVVNGMRITGSLTVDIGNSWTSIFSLNPQKRQIVEELIGTTSVRFKAKSVNFLQRKLMKQMLSRLRKLSVSSVTESSRGGLPQFIDNINLLDELEHLLIGKISNTYSRRLLLSLKFDQIRTLAIFSYSKKIVLIAPELTKLVLLQDAQSNLELVNANNLTHLILSTNLWPILSNSYPKDRIDYLRLLNANEAYRLATILEIVRTHTALRELHIELMSKRKISEIIKQKKITRNLNLVIYISGLPVDDLDGMERLFGNQTSLQIVPLSYIVTNLERLHSIHWVKKVDYSELVGYSDRLLVDAFLSKFSYIEQVAVGEIVDSTTSFIEFLKKCKMLKELTIKSSPFEQTFYDALHAACVNLEILHVELAHQQISLSFLLKHSQLRKFTINRDLQLAFVDRPIQLAPKRDFDLRFQLKGTPVHFFQTYRIWNIEMAGYTFSYSSSPNRPFGVIAPLKELLKLA